MKILAAMLFLALPAWSAQSSSCSNLCGHWQLDAARSDAAQPAIDAALSTYSDPRAKRLRRPSADDTAKRLDAEMEQALGPIHDRPERDDLRSELMSLLQAPARLNLESHGDDILIQGDSQVARRVSPGTPKARVDAWGTAKISTSWKPDHLTVSERYDSKRRYSETYTLQDGGTLLVVREVQRPGLKAVRIQSIYRRS